MYKWLLGNGTHFSGKENKQHQTGALGVTEVSESWGLLCGTFQVVLLIKLCHEADKFTLHKHCSLNGNTACLGSSDKCHSHFKGVLFILLL